MEAVKIVPLSRDNYVTWRNEISFVLKGEGCYSFIDRTALPVDDKTPRRDVEEYTRKPDRALAIIFHNLSSEYKHLIDITDHPADAWEKLEKHFNAPTRANLVRLLDEFFSIKPEPEEPVDIFCARLRKAVNKLRDVHHPVEQLYVAFQSIRYLPEEFRGIVQLIYRWPDKDFNLDNIQKELSAEEGRIRQQTKDSLNVKRISKLGHSNILKTQLKKFDLGCDVDKEEIFTYPYLTDEDTIAFIKDHNQVMFIIRGPNSTLKATLSEMIQNIYPTAQHCCADHYFSKTFSPPDRNTETFKLAHAYCKKKVEAACLKKESPIIIQNTHIRKFELQIYLEFASQYNYTVIMAVTLYKFNVTPEALEAVNPDGLNITYFRNRLRQWQDVLPVFTGWFLCSEDATFVIHMLQTTLPALLSDGKFIRVFDFYEHEAVWKYFEARRSIYCVAGISPNAHIMKKYYLSDLVQECYGKSYSITIQGYLVTRTTIMGIVHIEEDMLPLVLAKDELDGDIRDNSLHAWINSLDIHSTEYKDTIPFEHKNTKDSKTCVLEDWKKDETIDIENCRLVHLAQGTFKSFHITEIEADFYKTMKSLADEIQYTELEGVSVCRLPDDKWLMKLPQKIKVKTIFTGLYI